MVKFYSSSEGKNHEKLFNISIRNGVDCLWRWREWWWHEFYDGTGFRIPPPPTSMTDDQNESMTVIDDESTTDDTMMDDGVSEEVMGMVPPVTMEQIDQMFLDDIEVAKNETGGTFNASLGTGIFSYTGKPEMRNVPHLDDRTKFGIISGVFGVKGTHDNDILVNPVEGNAEISICVARHCGNALGGYTVATADQDKIFVKVDFTSMRWTATKVVMGAGRHSFVPRPLLDFIAGKEINTGTSGNPNDEYIIGEFLGSDFRYIRGGFRYNSGSNNDAPLVSGTYIVCKDTVCK